MMLRLMLLKRGKGRGEERVGEGRGGRGGEGGKGRRN